MEFSQEFGGVKRLEYGLWKLLDTVVVIALPFIYIENAIPVQGIPFPPLPSGQLCQPLSSR